jgi:hypothetical protein
VTSAAILQRTTDAFTILEKPSNQIRLNGWASSPDSTVTVHIPEGAPFRAAVRVIRGVCIKSRTSEVLPPVDSVDTSHRYVLLRWPSAPQDLSSSTMFTSTVPLPGLLIRRTKLKKALWGRLMVCTTDSCFARGYKCIRPRGVAVSPAVIEPTLARRPRASTRLPRLTPLALPSSPEFLMATSAAISAHNASASSAEKVLLLPGSMLRCGARPLFALFLCCLPCLAGGLLGMCILCPLEGLLCLSLTLSRCRGGWLCFCEIGACRLVFQACIWHRLLQDSLPGLKKGVVFPMKSPSQARMWNEAIYE